MKKIIVVFMTVFSIGCATNPYKDYYNDTTGGKFRRGELGPSPVQPELRKGSDKNNDIMSMMEDNYLALGYSTFSAGDVGFNGAIKQAKLVGADVVLVYSNYLNAVTGNMPMSVPDSQTTYTNVSGQVGNSNYSGSGYSTTYGTKTMNIPYSVDRYDYFAGYWMKMPAPKFGARVTDLTPEKRAEIGSNSGVLVIAVVKGSPAFKGDILAGDVIRKINKMEIASQDDYINALSKMAGKVTVEIIRSGKPKKISMALAQN